jgi:hypothetical protein
MNREEQLQVMVVGLQLRVRREDVLMITDSETDKVLFAALGEAVAKVWSDLPQTVQQNIFDQAATSQGETVKHDLAIFLHEKHSRTTDAINRQGVPEPDSLGG